MIRAAFFWVLMALPIQALAWTEPARGTATRAALMDAIRPHAEWILGSPIEFVVFDLRQAGDLAFAHLSPQRPGGGTIDPWETPGFRRGAFAAMELEITDVQVLYRRSGKTWVAVHWAIGATDVWYADPEICAFWGPVIPYPC